MLLVMAQLFLSKPTTTLMIYLALFQKDQVIDMILIVDDTYKFHKENMNFQNNDKHYSFFTKRLPLKVTDMVNNSGSFIYFNPLIPFKNFPHHELPNAQNTYNDQNENSNQEQAKDLRKIKYGIISVEKAVQDLKEWNAFALAGRLQKPVLTFINVDTQEVNENKSSKISQAIEQNRDQALNLALFMNFHNPHKNLHLMDLYTDLCGFSYKGDIRMRMKMENPNKVKNVVIGSFDQLNEVYMPRLKQLEKNGYIEQIDEHEFKIRPNAQNVQHLFDNIPNKLKTGMKESVVQMSLKELQVDVNKNLEKIVFYTSIDMIFSGLYSTNPLKNLSYVYSKFKKGRAK
eukprot:403345852